MCDDDDTPCLSQQTLDALTQFYSEQAQDGSTHQLDEDWQLSQFWYDTQTSETLAREVYSAIGDTQGSVACLCTPTLYQQLTNTYKNKLQMKLFEFDSRFSLFDDDFVFYDYKDPLKFPDHISAGMFDMVVVDPPFLAEECLKKISESVKFLAGDKIILCTGSVMGALAGDLLGLKKCKFQPKHVHNLGNNFSCYTNYETTFL